MNNKNTLLIIVVVIILLLLFSSFYNRQQMEHFSCSELNNPKGVVCSSTSTSSPWLQPTCYNVGKYNNYVKPWTKRIYQNNPHQCNLVGLTCDTVGTNCNEPNISNLPYLPS